MRKPCLCTCAFLLFVFCNLQAQYFSEQSIAAGVDHVFDVGDFMFGGGAVVFDYDNDGHEDVFIAGGNQPNVLYRNLGNGTFEEVASQAGLNVTNAYNTQGGAAADIDNDGDRDLFVAVRGPVTNMSAKAPNFLFLNNGDGTFTDISTSCGIIADTAFSTAATFGDVNLDGFVDLYVCNYLKEPIDSLFDSTGLFTHTPPYPSLIDLHGDSNTLFINNGDLTFTESTDTYEVGSIGSPWQAIFSDLDMDGDGDLYAANDFGLITVPNPLFKNEFPAASFNEMTGSGADFGIGAMGIAKGDYDRDGDLDLYVTSSGFNLLLQNQGDGTFQEVAEASGTQEHFLKVADKSMRYCHTYQPNAGYVGRDTVTIQSCYQGACDTIENVLVTLPSFIYYVPPSWPYVNTNHDLFGEVETKVLVDSLEEVCILVSNADSTTIIEDAVEGAIIASRVDSSSLSNGWGANWIDFDNDGHLDLFVSNGSLVHEMNIWMTIAPMLPNSFYRNNGNGTFSYETVAAGVDNKWRARGSVQFDYDQDGDEDILVVCQDYTALDTMSGSPRCLLYRNELDNTNHYLRVKVRGDTTNSDGIGAMIRLRTAGSQMIREVEGGSSSQSHNSLIAHFGLGSATTVDTLIVDWMGGGSDTILSLPADRQILVIEGANWWYGTVDTDWLNPANWSKGTVPGVSSDVFIPPGKPRYPELGTGVFGVGDDTGSPTFVCRSLRIQEDAQVTCLPGNTITNYGLISVAGALNVQNMSASAVENFANGEIIIRGSGSVNMNN